MFAKRVLTGVTETEIALFHAKKPATNPANKQINRSTPLSQIQQY